MKAHCIFASLLILLFSCDKQGNEINPSDTYFINFKIKDESGKVTDINLPYGIEQGINGNGVKDSDSVWVGFGFSVFFNDPTNNSIQQKLSFHIGFPVPEEELSLDSNRYYFNNPSAYLKYISTENLYQVEHASFSTFFHENLNTFCSAQNDEKYNNNFTIYKKEFFIDEKNNDALLVEGKFKTKYNSICQNGTFEITEGNFRIKVLIDEIP